MCIGVTILVAPPTVIGAGCLMWYSGEQVALSQLQKQRPINRSLISYGAGIATLAGTYTLQRPLIEKLEGSNVRSQLPKKTTELFTPPHKATNPFKPPQTLTELYETLGRPFLARLGAGSVAFFFSGAVHVYVASLF
jgi:hypothetical protein